MDRHNSLGEAIRDLRRQQHITQEQLAEGICSPITVSRIENGHQMPSKAILDALLSRLHSSVYQLCNVYYQSERDHGLEDALKRASILLQDGKLDDCKALLEKHDVGSWDDPIYRQLYLALNAAVLLNESPRAADAQQALVLLERAVRLTQPGIDLENMRQTLLSQNEAQALALMIPALLYAERPLDAILFGRELLAALDSQEADSKEHHEVCLNVEFNLAQCLELQGYYDESEELVHRAERESRQERLHHYLPQLIYSEARICLRKGDAEGARRRLVAVIPYLDVIGDADLASLMRGWAHRELKVEL